MVDLVIPLKGEYFKEIASGIKPEEFRLTSDYWKKRLVGRSYDRIILTLGYPKVNDHSRRLIREWRGYEVKTITHPLFGEDPVEVFAINVSVAFNESISN